MTAQDTNQTEQGSERSILPSEAPGDLRIKTLKEWMQRRTYAEKLAAVALWQLISNESDFEKPDNDIGNRFANQWEDEVTAASADPDYLHKADPEEVAVTAAVAMMIPWQVLASKSKHGGWPSTPASPFTERR